MGPVTILNFLYPVNARCSVYVHTCSSHIVRLCAKIDIDDNLGD